MAAEAREVLVQQMAIPWALAESWCLPRLDDAMVHWAPSPHAVGLEARDGGWYPRMPDETAEPIPDVTCAWLLWHVEWWWSNALRGVAGEPALGPDDVPWSGGAGASRATIARLHDEWVAVLASADLDHPCSAPWPHPQPLSLVAAWVNLELMKNVAELGQLVRLHANRAA